MTASTAGSAWACYWMPRTVRSIYSCRIECPAAVSTLTGGGKKRTRPITHYCSLKCLGWSTLSAKSDYSAHRYCYLRIATASAGSTHCFDRASSPSAADSNACRRSWALSLVVGFQSHPLSLFELFELLHWSTFEPFLRRRRTPGFCLHSSMESVNYCRYGPASAAS